MNDIYDDDQYESERGFDDWKTLQEIIDNMDDEEFEEAMIEAGIENCPLIEENIGGKRMVFEDFCPSELGIGSYEEELKTCNNEGGASTQWCIQCWSEQLDKHGNDMTNAMNNYMKRKPNVFSDNTFECSRCDMDIKKYQSFCTMCGQNIDWSNIKL